MIAPKRSPTVLTLAALGTLVAGCGSATPGARGPVNHIEDPTPLAKCRISASHENPLVTEWPASEKAHLETLLSSQAVAVQYSGCELKIIDACKLPGSYTWVRTTLSTDTVQIADADELYAKLPLGAVSLEGELERSGRLAIRTTVAGQLRLDQQQAQELPKDGTCDGVTHVINGISVGAFSLLSGGSVSGSGGVGVAGVGAGGSSRREESTLRESGNPTLCADATDEAPHGQCSSPIQLFLRPLAARAQDKVDDERLEVEAAERRARTRGVFVSLPASDDPDERWSLHDADGRRLCDLPCQRWIAPRSGYYLEREKTRGYDSARIDVPHELPHTAGSQVSAEYATERGQPFWSKLGFYGLGLPCAFVGTIAVIFAATEDDNNGFWAGASVMYFSIAAATTVWFLYSRPTKFDTYTARSSGTWQQPSPPPLMLGPGFVQGTF
jgi:hypothetical protein